MNVIAYLLIVLVLYIRSMCNKYKDSMDSNIYVFIVIQMIKNKMKKFKKNNR